MCVLYSILLQNGTMDISTYSHISKCLLCKCNNIVCHTINEITTQCTYFLQDPRKVLVFLCGV